ncbi:hypothetical protein E6O75_ATG03177 [Venturia nashicola]|uniref:Uncharacterized protein n=1 Tax=Venturia nashicola TaxID=86259 RepID=A0A4Z1PEG9_9PEZI|nr:hypothetical protein E6O75_ATG03177 [Venturia nashicola]
MLTPEGSLGLSSFSQEQAMLCYNEVLSQVHNRDHVRGSHNTHYDNNGYADHDTTACFSTKFLIGESPNQVAQVIALENALSHGVPTLAATMIAPWNGGDAVHH